MLADILGQGEVAAKFINAWKQGRLAQAYILTGPDGIGKTPFAIELVKTFLCGEKGDDACERCPSCRKVNHSNHEDVEVMQPTGRGNVIHMEEVDELIGKLRYRTRSGEHRFVIIRDADRMGDAPANHFLKTLEEPPTNVTFFLLTARPSFLLETIVSRCQVVRMHRATSDEIERFLTDRGYSEAEARLYASLSDGCPGRAVGLKESGVYERRERILQRIMGLNSGNQAPAAADMLNDNRAQTLAASREAHYTDLTLMAALYRDLALLAEGAERSLLYNPDVADRLQERAAAADPARLREQTLHILEARSNIQKLINPDLVISELFMDLAC